MVVQLATFDNCLIETKIKIKFVLLIAIFVIDPKIYIYEGTILLNVSTFLLLFVDLNLTL